MKIKFIQYCPFILAFLVPVLILSQEPVDFIGAGNHEGIVVITSSEQPLSGAENTINGSGLDAPLMEAARFLSQASFGENMDEIKKVTETGIEAWIDEQMDQPVSPLLDDIDPIWDTIVDRHEKTFEARVAENILELCEIYPDTSFSQADIDEAYEEYLEDIFGPTTLQFNYAWWHNMMTAEDQLRQRMAFALSQILVVSAQSDLGDHAHALAGYYDILLRNAFGNYRDLLMEITLSPAMAYYLSHLNNPKAIPEQNIHPDENYAREIMQLFTIGLHHLNPDGTPVLDAEGNRIPTYDNNDIAELAKVFTGLGPGELDPYMVERGAIWWTDTAYFGMDLYPMHKWAPLKMYEEWHQPGEKIILKDLIIPAGQSGLEDIEMAVDYLFRHPNTGPFVSHLLIQRFVKSNPSPEYISRISAVFADNGNGVRGDLGAVLKAILMDKEARECAFMQNITNGKLREPVLRHSLYSRAIPMKGQKAVFDVEISSYDCEGISYTERTEELAGDLRYWHNGFINQELLRQNPLMSPSVFNFYLPDHMPVGEMSELGLTGPEFKIHDTGAAVNYVNLVLTATLYEFNMYSFHSQLGIEYIMPDFRSLHALADEDPEGFLNYLDIVFTHGELSDSTRENLRSFIDVLKLVDNPDLTAKLLTYFILISPDFTILK